MFKAGSAARNFLITIVVGGVVIGACLAALIPGVLALTQANTSVSGGVAPLRDLSQRSTVYDSAGNVIGILGTQNREQATLAEVPKIVQDAVISVEDRTFWTNDGIDLNGLARAFVTNLTSGKIEQGGSTITQQLVKNRILSSSRDVNRKVKEIVLALRLNEKYSKNEILEQYLNTVYFGQGSYGIKSAAERFFLTVDPGQPFPRGKKLSELTIGEAALLAGVISNPEGNNPFVNPDGTKERRRLALASMVKGGYITEAEEAAGNAEPLPTVKPSAELRPTNSWTEEVQDQLYDAPMFSMLGATREQRKNAVLTGGLKIFATLDPVMQEDAQNAMDQVLPEKPGWTGSLVSMDPRTGAVKAMVAGPG
ncbi:MAG: transglycosylase domain-containing protein, partial [Acidimicrobiia bacterium]|nr:transglycosylase domain-containing protein [Acidimicrobiia bacterium]